MTDDGPIHDPESIRNSWDLDADQALTQLRRRLTDPTADDTRRGRYYAAMVSGPNALESVLRLVDEELRAHGAESYEDGYDQGHADAHADGAAEDRVCSAVRQRDEARATIADVETAARHPHKGPDDTDASMLRAAAKRLRGGYEPGGSWTKQTVANVLDAVAAALAGPAEEAPAVARCPKCGHQPHGRVYFNIQSDNDCSCEVLS